MNKFKGIILITLLLFLQIFALLSLYFLQSSMLASYMSRTYWQKSQLFYHAEEILFKIEDKVGQGEIACLIPKIDNHLLLDKPLNEWPCHGQESQWSYYYLIEYLGHDVCAIVDDKTVRYYRITLLFLNNKEDIRELLQSTIIKLDNANAECNETVHHVLRGRQAWRSLQRSF